MASGVESHVSLQPPRLQGEYPLSSRRHRPAPYSGYGSRQPARDAGVLKDVIHGVGGWGIAPAEKVVGRPNGEYGRPEGYRNRTVSRRQIIPEWVQGTLRGFRRT